MLLYALGIISITYLLLNLIKINTHWKRKGIPCLKPWPIFGNLASSAFRQRPLADLIKDFYSAYQDHRYVGFYQFMTPTLLVNDPDLIRQITVKEFDTFADHNMFVANDNTVASKNLFGLSVKNGWHDMRATLSPSFTSNKMRTMFVLMEQCANQFIVHFEKRGEFITVEMKDVFSRFTNDLIGTAAFGVTCDSLEFPNNEFYLMGKDLTDFGGIKQVKFFGYTISPTLMRLFGVTIFSAKVTKFFQNLIKETLRVREEKKIVRPDMIHLLMEARKGLLKHEKNDVIDTGFAVVEESELGKTQRKTEITEDDITAQALIFFLAGFDTASITMSYTAYELAINADVQEKLQAEIDTTLKDCGGKITYETLLGMKYLDNVISETLRKWPPGFMLDRKTVKPFTINSERPGEKTLFLETGTICLIPVIGIHRDPKYYPDPEKFDPKRFSDENENNIKPFTYLPFGSGPRSCIGSRFVLLETKLIILKILEKFTIVPVKKTQIPIRFDPKEIFILPKGGFWLGLKLRTTN